MSHIARAARSHAPLFVLACVNAVYGILIYITGVRIFRHTLVDDAFITFRFARNIAAGHGIVWNIGGERVEGYTSPLQVLLMVPAFWAGWEPLATMQVIGVLCLAVIIPLLLIAESWRRFGNAGGPAFGLALLLPGWWWMSHPNVSHAFSGMETPIVMVLYLVFGLFMARCARQAREAGTISWKDGALLLALAWLVTLSRSEAGAIAVGGLGVLLVQRETRRAAVVMLCAYFAGLALYLLWKWLYFGHLLPTPYYHKMVDRIGLLPGRKDVMNFMNHHLFLLVIPLISWVAWPTVKLFQRDPLELYAAGGFLFYSVFFMRVEHIMGFEFRFLWHAMPFLMVLNITSIEHLSRLFRPGLGAERWSGGGILPIAQALAAGVVMCLLLSLRLPHPHTRYALARTPLNPQRAPQWLSTHWRIGKALQSLDLSYDTLINGTEAGIIPYFSNTRTIDLVGLTDLTMTHGSYEEKRAYLAANPFDVHFTVSTTGAPDDNAHSFELIEEDPQRFREHDEAMFRKLAAEYYYAGNFRVDFDPRRQDFVFWVRRAHPRSQEIVRALLNIADTSTPPNFRYGPYEEEVAEAIELPE